MDGWTDGLTEGSNDPADWRAAGGQGAGGLGRSGGRPCLLSMHADFIVWREDCEFCLIEVGFWALYKSPAAILARDYREIIGKWFDHRPGRGGGTCHQPITDGSTHY